MATQPTIDLRKTQPLGEPHVPPKLPDPKRQVHPQEVFVIAANAIFAVFLIAIGAVTIWLFGPIIGGIICLLLIGRLDPF